MRTTEIKPNFLQVRDRYKDDPRLSVVMDAVMENVDDAAACSHRPENVQRLWQDANSRHYMALAILAALDDVEPM